MAGLLEYTKNGQVTEPPLYRFMKGNVQSFLNSIPDPSGLTKEEQLNMAANMNPTTGLLGTFIGKGSKLWNSTTNDVAKSLEKEGVAPETIWSQTGNVKAPDGKWRQEISDENLKFNEDAYKAFRKKREYQGQPFLNAKTDLYDLVSHPELKKAYPESKDIAVLRGNSYDGGGSASPVEWDYINLGIPMWEQRAAQDNSVKNTLVHELQHQIQAGENFARGGDTNMFNTITPPKDVQKQLKIAQDKFESLIGGSPERIQAVEDYNKILGEGDKYSPYGQYLRLAGEAEARLAANRIPLTQEQRLQYYPYAQGQYGLDVPYNELVVKGLLK
jgi:hypothetical protein